MPLSLLHKGRRKWMGRREKSGTSPADGRAQNAGTPPPVQAGRRRGPLHSARGASKADGRMGPPLRIERNHSMIGGVPLIRHGFAAPPSPKGEGRGMGLPKPSPLGEGAPEGGR